MARELGSLPTFGQAHSYVLLALAIIIIGLPLL